MQAREASLLFDMEARADAFQTAVSLAWEVLAGKSQFMKATLHPKSVYNRLGFDLRNRRFASKLLFDMEARADAFQTAVSLAWEVRDQSLEAT